MKKMSLDPRYNKLNPKSKDYFYCANKKDKTKTALFDGQSIFVYKGKYVILLCTL